MGNARKTAAFHLDGLGTRYAFFVSKPAPAARKEATPWITLLCLDGDDWFEEMRKARNAVTRNRKMPPLLLVGIGYGACHGQPGNRRVRDYTPVPSPDGDESGGAGAFMTFLTRTVWPEIERRYPVHPSIRGIAGHSLGGLFALHALFGPTRFFNRVLASAPSIWWGDRVILKTVAVKQREPVDMQAKLFVGIGLKDGRSMLGDVDLLESQLAERPVKGLEVSKARFPDRTHFSAIPISFRTGLVALFA